MGETSRRPRSTDGFTWSQFRVLFRAIRKGEDSVDDLGFSGLGAGASSKRRGRLPKLPPIAQKALQVLVFAGLAVVFFFMGVGLESLSAPELFRFLAGVLLIIELLTGVYAAVNLLYFARDNAYYLTLPVAPTALMWAKLANYLTKAALGSLILLPMGFGALWARFAPPSEWVLLTVAFLIATAIINLVVTALTIVLMRFSRFAHDKDRFSRFFGVIVMVLALSFGVGIQFVAQGAAGGSAIAAASGVFAEGPLAIALGVVCAPVLLADLIFSAAPLTAALGLAGSALALAAWCVVISVLASRWYLEGMRSFTGSGGRRSTRVFDESELRGLVSSRSGLAAFLARDWKVMVRTPVFFNQFVLGPLLMPVYLIAIFAVVVFIGLSRAGVDPMAALEQVGAFSSMLTFGSFPLTVAAFAVLVFRVFMSMNGYVTTLAVSREGADFFYLRSLPMRWRPYLASKLLTSLPGDAVLLVFVAVILLVAQVPLVSIAYLLVLLAASSISLSLFSLAQGALFPRLHWENEAQLVKGGSAVISVYLTMIFGAVVCALPGLVLACPIFFEIELAPEIALLGALGIQLLVLAGLAWFVFVVAARSLARREP
ncbi:MAG: hypothetical protein E7001_07940 [Coriobacteriaceae bacterium]|nr:hypothetical protein [Coriobacteriaceae bacterium]